MGNSTSENEQFEIMKQSPVSSSQIPLPVQKIAFMTNDQILAQKGKQNIDTKKRNEKRQILVFSERQLIQWPKDIFDTDNLTWLDISHNNLESIPDEIGLLRSLKRLACGNNLISTISPSIGKLRKLTWLDLTHNRLHEIPESLGLLDSLTGLGLSDCQFTEFPKPITKLTKLLKLGLFGNNISNIPCEINNLASLTKFDISHNLITTLPPELGDLVALRWLNLSNNHICELPKEINRLKRLEELGLGGNKLTFLPNLELLQSLKVLPVFGNQLNSIESWIGNLNSLEKLDLSSNQLTEIPVSIFKMKSLVYLNFRKNHVSKLTLPDSWNVDRPELQNKSVRCKIKALNCSDNRIEELPFGLIRLPLEEFQYRRNPLKLNLNEKIVYPQQPQKLSIIMTNKLLNTFQDSNRMSELLEIFGSEISVLSQLHLKSVRLCHSCCKFYVHEPVNQVCQVSGYNGIFASASLVKKVCSMKCSVSEPSSE